MILLETTQVETPQDKILGKQWEGEFQLLCTTYGTSPVKMQVRAADGEWINAKFDTEEIQLTAAGEVLDIKLARDYDYRLVTDTAGAEVYIAKHNVGG